MSYVVTVEFKVSASHVSAFMQRMLENARESMRIEPGCLQFDVCRGPARPEQIFLYEVYVDRQAFEAHLASPHFKAFERATVEWILSKSVATYLREE